jgi:small subunit ribosomal protein S20
MTRESPVAKEKKAVLRASRPRRGRSLDSSGSVANIASQEKRIHRAERERLENRRRTSQVRTFFHRLERAVESGDPARADEELRGLVSRIDKAVKSGALHRNTAARKKARAARLRARV